MLLVTIPLLAAGYRRRSYLVSVRCRARETVGIEREPSRRLQEDAHAQQQQAPPLPSGHTCRCNLRACYHRYRLPRLRCHFSSGYFSAVSNKKTWDDRFAVKALLVGNTHRNVRGERQCGLNWSGRPLYRLAKATCHWFGADRRDLLAKRCQLLRLGSQRLELLPGL